jgi:hypothetical protein
MTCQPRRRDVPPNGRLSRGMHVPPEANLETLQGHVEIVPDHVKHVLNFFEQFARQQLFADSPRSDSLGSTYSECDHDSLTAVLSVDPKSKQFGQYQGAGVFTGFGLRLWHLAHRKRLPFTAVFGRTFFPVLRIFLSTGTSRSPKSLVEARRCATRNCDRRPMIAARIHAIKTIWPTWYPQWASERWIANETVCSSPQMVTVFVRSPGESAKSVSNNRCQPDSQ